jgi:hypothetical protein
MQPAAAALDRELTLFEYGTCWDTVRNSPAPAQTAALFDRQQRLQEYVEKNWLTPSFDSGQPCLKASHFVGLLPFSAGDEKHLLLIAPKGCRQDFNRGLRHFLELLALGEDKKDKDETPPMPAGWEGQKGPHLFLLFLAHHYAGLLQELCRRDFRSYYRPEEDELRSRIRGRLRLPAYARLAVRGKSHVLPCRWDEFTVDNWDNRILWDAARRLKQVAGVFDPQAAAWIWQPFQRLLPWFGAVAEVPIAVHDLRKSRLGRTSRYYRHALAWAELLLRGSNVPTAGGQASALVLDANKAFEKFAEVVVRTALPDAGWHLYPQQNSPFLRRDGQVIQSRRPDILISAPCGERAVGDAKYKDVLDRVASEQLGNGEEVSRVGIQENDWNQLYVYMRMTGASRGFFIVPFWNAQGQPAQLLDNFKFEISPCDGNVRLAVLALNLLQPLQKVKEEAAKRLREWLLA